MRISYPASSNCVANAWRHAYYDIQHLECFGFGQDRGEAFGFTRTHRVHRLNLLVEDLLIETEQRAQGLILRGRRDMRSTAKWVRNASISTRPIAVGWRL